MAADTRTPFPNYLQMRQPAPMAVWYLARIVSIGCAVALIVTLFVCPRAGFTLWWGFFIPLLPLWFFVAPGLWRNVCPMAALNQTPRLLRFTLGRTPPVWLKEYGYVIAIALFLAIVPTRKVIFNSNGPALAILLIVSLVSAFLGGLVFKGKSGWCSSVCPLLPVQRVYGQTPFVVLPNAHCQPCVGCAKNCYDFNPHVAYVADMNDDDQQFSGYRRAFVGAFPGLVLAFYTVPTPPAISDAGMYLRFLLYLLASVGSFYLLLSFLKATPYTLTTLYGAAALNIYYWYNFHNLATQVHTSFGITVLEVTVWCARAVVLALTLLWIDRTLRKERAYIAASGVQPSARLGRSLAGALDRAGSAGEPEVTFVPDGKRVAAPRGRTLLDVAEECGMAIEAGCRMGMCGADPVAVTEGMDNLSPVRADERSTLDRLGLGETARLACCAKVLGPVTLSVGSAPAPAAPPPLPAGARVDRTVGRVVIVGNGIAGVTAADHARRRHPDCEITIVAREPHHLYNRMAIERLIYGRSAMQGLYLMPESWYDERRITCLLNTRVGAIDRAAQEVVLGTGERLPYDRLILAMGSSSTLPPIAGFGLPGSFTLREAGDAMQIRAFAQENNARRAVVAGGGLLGLEAAYALQRLGLRVTVLERSSALLRRQLDPRGSGYLQEYLEGLGLEVLLEAEVEAVVGSGRVESLRLRDGRDLPADVLMVAAGITPNVALARDANLATNRGVIVDDEMRTSDPRIFAAGDVAEYDGEVYGLWPTACDQAEVAGANAVGGEQRFTLVTPVTMLKVVGVDLLSVGRFTRERRGEMAIVQMEEGERGQRYRRVLIADGRIVGGILLGYPLDAPNVIAAVRQQADVSSCLEDLKEGRWDVLAALV